MREREAKDLLESVSAMLASDGYELSVVVGDDRVDIAIEATADACADCLVPRAVMIEIMRAALGEQRLVDEGYELTVRYPIDQVH